MDKFESWAREMIFRSLKLRQKYGQGRIEPLVLDTETNLSREGFRTLFKRLQDPSNDDDFFDLGQVSLLDQHEILMRCIKNATPENKRWGFEQLWHIGLDDKQFQELCELTQQSISRKDALRRFLGQERRGNV